MFNQHQNDSDTVILLRCAFPDSINQDEYFPLLYILNEYMGFRSLAQNITVFLDNNFELINKLHGITKTKYLSNDDYYALILNDAYFVASAYKPKQDMQDNLLKRLNLCGFQNWTDAEMERNKARFFQEKTNSFWQHGKYDDALKVINKAIELEQSDCFLLIQRANLYEEMSRLDDALSDFTKAIELYPENANMYEYRGTFYESQGEFDNAIEDFSKAINLAKDNFAPLYRFRSYLYTQVGDLRSAINDLNLAMTYGGNTFVYYFSRAKILYELGDYEDALLDLQTAQNISINNSSEDQAVNLLIQKIKTK